MGVTIFVARVGSLEELNAIIADVVAHNREPFRLIGSRLPEDNHLRVQMEKAIAQLNRGKSSEVIGFSVELTTNVFSRGDPIDDRSNSALVVSWDGEYWVELPNYRADGTAPHGAQDSLDFFERRRVSGATMIKWFGSGGKPKNFRTGARVCHTEVTLGSLMSTLMSLPAKCAPLAAHFGEPLEENILKWYTPVESVRHQTTVTSQMMQLGRLSNKCAVCGSTDDPKTCSVCAIVQYCSKKCQKAHWPTHKQACRERV